MKYRILEKTRIAPTSGRPLKTFTPQKKYMFWPFWINLYDYILWEIGDAQQYIDDDRNNRVKLPVIIHEYTPKNILDKAEEHSKMYPQF